MRWDWTILNELSLVLDMNLRDIVPVQVYTIHKRLINVIHLRMIYLKT